MQSLVTKTFSRIHSLIYLLLFALAVTNTQAQADSMTNQEPPVWSMNSTLSKKLTNKVDGVWFSMRLPNQYDQVELDTTAYEKAGIKVAAFRKESGRSVKSAITIMSLPAPTTPANNDKELFEGLVKSLTARWPDTHSTGVIQGRWDGREAYRFEFSASEKKEKIKGVVYAVISSKGIFVVSTVEPVNPSDGAEAFRTLEQAALSCRPK